MNDSGANQTTPIVHNGIIYLASPSNIVQALDAKTGDLIWETRVGPDQAPGYGGIRSIAIAEDKIFLPTSDAHMVAHQRPQRPDSLGHAGVRQAACVDQRRDRDRRQGADGSHRLRAVRRRRLLHQRVRHPHRRARVAVLHDPARRAAGQRHVGQAADEQPRRARRHGWRAATIPNSTSPTGAWRSRSHGIS